MNDHSPGLGFAPARLSVNDLVARHGAWQVFLLALSALLKPRPRSSLPGVAPMSDHLRRDVGLAPLAAPVPRHWPDLR